RPGRQIRRRDPGRRRRLGAHPADRNGDGPRGVAPGAGDQRHHPRRGTDLRRRPRPDRKPGDEHTAGRSGRRPRELPGQHRPGPGRAGRAGRSDRGRVPAQRLPVASGGLQPARLGRELRVPGPAGRPLDRRARRSDVRLPVQRRQRGGEHPGIQSGPGDARGRPPVSVRPAEPAGHGQRRPAGACRQHADGLGKLRPDRQPVVARTALAVVQRNQGAVARAAAVAGHDRLRDRSPLLVLGRVTHLQLRRSIMSTSDLTPTVVLVHGAFVDASSWNGVIAELKAAGLDVVAPPNLLRGVGTDAAYLTGFVEALGRPVVLVAHSYAGAVISQTGSDASNVVGLVYVAAYAPEAGETLGAINARYPDVPLSAALRTFTYTDERGEQATDTYVHAALFHDAVCAEAPADVADTLARTQRPASP